MGSARTGQALRRGFLVAAAAWIGVGAGDPLEARDGRSGRERVETLRESLARRADVERANAAVLAERSRWVERGTDAKGRFFELRAIRRGVPLYLTTFNEEAAISTGADSLRAGPPYSATGLGVLVGVWDGGAVRPTHREFGDRVDPVDGASPNYHATHVGGTIGAVGVVEAARGMAPAVALESYDWTDDTAEMAGRAAVDAGSADVVRLSNHSYGFITGWAEGNFSGNSGWHWFGSDHGTVREDERFGQYTTEARSWDEICRAAPYFLPFKAAGNDRDDGKPATGETYYYFDPASGWTAEKYDEAFSPFADGYDEGGFDTIGDAGIAKNVITVGAVDDAVAGGTRDPSQAAMSSFSGWGPTDDGRIKPDLVANGVALYSTHSASDSSYATLSGTSMATPNAAGTAALLQEIHARQSGGNFARASTLKALLLHTADDLGTPGPDFSYGWGLVDAVGAADVILRHFESPGAQTLTVDVLAGADARREVVVRRDGPGPLRATLVWTDPAGPAVDGLDAPAPVLVHDLDLRIVGPGGTVYRPFVLDPADPALAATTGDNDRDNVEQVLVPPDAPPGDYRIEVSVEGDLGAEGQGFSLVVSGQLTGALSVTPTTVAGLSGEPGGPFSPDPVEFLVSNEDPGTARSFTVTSSADWLEVSPTEGSLPADGSAVAVEVSPNAAAASLPVGEFFAQVVFGESPGGTVLTRTIRLDVAVDPLSEVFAGGAGGVDLANRSVTFHPDGSGRYVVTVDEAPELPFAPGAELADPPDDGSIRLSPPWAGGFRFFGEPKTGFHVNTNGNLTFDGGDADWRESTGEHFARERIAVLFDDFDPTTGGSIRYRHVPGDRAAVTFENLPEWGTSNASTFQVELFDDGSDRIRMTFLDLAAADGIVGLSDGGGEPAGFSGAGVDFTADYAPSPVVSLAVLDGAASEWNADTDEAHLRVENAHPFPLPLSVPLEYGGTASPADDLQKAPSSVGIPAGATGADLVLAAVLDAEVEGPESLEIVLAGSGGFPRLGSTASASVLIEDRPADRWAFDRFGGATTGTADGEDFDGDGVSNLVEYALGMDPTRADSPRLPDPSEENGFLFLPYEPDPRRTDVRVTGESSTDLERWNPDDVIRGEDGFRTPLEDGGKYLRLRVERKTDG